MRSNGAGKLGSRAGEPAAGWWGVVFFRSQLPFEPIWPPDERYVVSAGNNINLAQPDYLQGVSSGYTAAARATQAGPPRTLPTVREASALAGPS
jgi:hypothetical protein